MKFKRIILISFILCFLSMACVSASDNQTLVNNPQINDIDAIIVVDEEISEYENDIDFAENNASDERAIVSDGMLSSNNVDDMLSALNEGTRDELNNLILAAKPGSTITLDKDYRFVSGVKTIEITKNIVIDGNGHTIYLGYNRAFTFNYINPAGKIELTDITFVSGIGGAIYFTVDSCPFTISYCRFINCSANDGGAISGQAKYNSNIVGCTFKGCYGSGESKVVRKETVGTVFSGAFSSGGALWISGSVNVKSCRFEHCSAGDGGAISVYDNCQIIDCVFIENKAGRKDSIESFEHGGAIRIKGGSGALIKGCTFNYNHAGRFGGAISSFGNNVKIEDCSFNSNYVDNSLNQKGGAIFVSAVYGSESPVQITRCTFNNNGYNNNGQYCKYGGAIYFNKGIILGSVSYCNFTGNGASKEGGAIYASSDCRAFTFSNCLFTKNNVDKYGGAIYLDSKTSTIFECAFVDQPNAVYCDNKECSIKFSTFLRNSNYDIWSTKQINIVNNWFGNTMENRYANLAKLKGKASIVSNFENLYLVATSMDKNYHNGLDSAVNLNLKYIYESPADSTKLSSSNYLNPAIRYVVSGVNAAVDSSNLYLKNGKSTFKFKNDVSKSSSSVTVDCYGAKITLRFNSNPNSFTALQSAIDSCQNGVLNLTHNYTRDKSIDGDMSITISKNLVINGNGFTIDSKNIARVININNNNVNVEINNLNIVNGKSNYGGAIYAYANNLIINNCKFTNCTVRYDGGAIRMVGKRITIINSEFINVAANENGGSVFISCSNKDNVIRNCIFINSTAGKDGSFIFVDVNSGLNLTNSIFLTDSATRYIGKPSRDRSVTFNIENNWFGGTNEDILKNYDKLNNITVKSLLYLNATASIYDIPVGNTSKISLKFYSYDLNSRRNAPLTNFRNMKFSVKLLEEGGKLSSDSIILINNEGNVVYTSSSNGIMPVEINYELFKDRIFLYQYNDNSFIALQYLINTSGNVINLTKDYTFSNISDNKLLEGILINKNLTINGNNHVISGVGQARIFNIKGNEVILNNITFIKGKADNGGVIFTSTPSSLSINSCRFENNSAENGGALYLKGYYLVNIDSSIFKNNSATASGGAIYFYGFSRDDKLCSISGTFINNRASNEGGAIYLLDDGKYRLEGIFTNNSAGKNGGAVCSDNSIGIPNFSIGGVFNSNTAAYGGAVYSYNPYGNITGTYQNNRASKDGGAIYMIKSASRYGMPNNISGEFYSNVAGGQGSAVCAMNLQNMELYDSIFMKNSGKSTIYSSCNRYLNVYGSIFVDNDNVYVLDTANNVGGGLKVYNNWFGNNIDNLDKRPSVGEGVVLNDWLFLDVNRGKAETYFGSKNNIAFALKSYDAKKGTVSDYYGDLKLNLSLKSNNGNLSSDSFILGNVPVEVTYVPHDYGENKIVVFTNLSKYSYNTYEIKYNVVDYPSDSFYGLQYEIDNMKGNVLNLSNNYEFYPEIDVPEGIKINKSITINGNGFIIDGKNGSLIFNILADNVVLENVSLINGNGINGSAIYAEGENITIRNSILLNNFDVVIYAKNSLNANYNWWGNTVDTFDKKANVSSNVILDNALFAKFNANTNIIGAGNKTTLTLNLTNLYNFNSKTNSAYNGLNLFAFDFNAFFGNLNVTSDKLKEGIIYVSFEAMGPLYGEIYARYEGVELKYEFEVVYDDDSFNALYNLINKTKSGDVVNLTHDYKFYYYDVDYVNGIPIDNALTINGNGFDISGMNESSIFTVSADNVSLTNINFCDALNAVEWLGNNGLINNVTFNNTYSALYCLGSGLLVRNSNFTRANGYSVYIEGSNHVVDGCRFVDNFGPSIFGNCVNNLNITDSVFMNIYSPVYGTVGLDGCNNVNIADCIFDTHNYMSIGVLEGSTVYLFNNTLSKFEYIFNNGTILSKTFVCMDDVNSSYMVGDVILLNATIYDDNENVILVDEFNFKIGEKLVRANLNIDAYEYNWILTNGSWVVVPDISEKSFANCTIDSFIVDVAKYNSSVNITSISDVIYGDDVNIGFEFENSTAVLVTIILGYDVVFTKITDAHSISISNLNTGVYDVIISTLENEFYQSSNATSEFIVNKAGSSVTLKYVGDIYYGEDLIINWTVENRTSVIASIYDVGDGEFIFNGDVEGDSLIINDLPIGSYSITLTNIIGPNYNPSGDYALFNVLKVNSSIIIDNKTEYVYDNVLINYTVDNLTNISVTVVDLESGEMDSFITTNSTIRLDLDAGSYQITLVNVETENVFASQDLKEFTVIPANSSVEIEDIDDVYYGDDIEIYFNVINATNVTVIVKDENNNVIYQNSTNESYYFDLSNLTAGKYSVEVYNSASNNFNPSNDTKTFYVLKAGSLIEFDYLNVTSYGIPFRLDYDVDNETLLNIRIYDSEGYVIYDKNFNEISELPDDSSNLTEEAYLGFYFFIYRNLTVGNYTFELTNLGNSNVSGDMVNGSFEIIKTTSEVEVLVDSIVFGEDLEVYIGVINATTVEIVIKDVEGAIVYDDVITSSPVIISDLVPGNYTVIVTNYDTENVIGNSSSQDFCVYKVNSTVELDNISNIYYEDTVLIDFNVENKTVVNVRIQNQDGEVVYDNNVTLDILLIPNLNVGNYTVTVTNLESFNISQSSDSKSFRVLKRSINIIVIVEDNVYGDLSVINVFSDIDGMFAVNVGTQQLFVNVVDGYGRIMINLDAGNYTAYVNYTNDNYDINMTNSSFVVFKANVTLSIEVLDKVYTADITGNVFASVDGEYNVVVDDTIISVTVLNGIGEFNLGILRVGSYTVSVIYNGTDNYEANVNETTFKYTQSGTNFNIGADNNNITYGDSLKVTHALPGDASGTIIYSFANGTVIKILNVNESLVLSNLDAGSHVIYANYSGDSNYGSARDSLTVTVNKAVNNIVVSSENTTYPKNSIIKVEADIDGEYVVIIGDEQLIVKVINGVGFNSIALGAGSYLADVEYLNKNYENNISSIPFTVAKADVTLIIEVLDKVYTAEITGNVFASVDGEYSVVISDILKVVSVKNGVGEFNLGILSVGNYSAYVIFDENENYNGNFNSSSFKVTKTGTNFNIIVNNTFITSGESINITQNLPSDATGNITYAFANGTIIKVLNVCESFVLSDLDEGSYLIYANYSGDSNYDSASDSVTIVVNSSPEPSKKNLTIIASADAITIGEDATVIVTGLKDATGDVVVVVDGMSYSVPIVGGVAIITVNALTENVTAIVSYAGDDKYNNASTTVDIVVNSKPKQNATISIDAPSESTEGDNVTVTVTLPEDAAGSVTIGNEVVPVVNGTASAVLTNLPAGNTTVPITYSGDDKYNPIETSVNISVKEDISDKIIAPDVTKYYNGPERFVVTVTDYKGNPIANANVKIYINGVVYERTTGTNGQTSIALAILSGNYTAVVEYNGTKTNATIVIKSTVSGNNITKIFRNGTQYYARFFDSEGNLLVNTPVSFNINGVFYTRVTDASGFAKLNINLNPGEYIITATNPNSSEMYSNIVTVLPNIVENNDLVKYYRNASQYVVRLLDDEGNPVGAGVEVSFNINGVFYTRTTNATGYAKMNINLVPGEYIITAEYNGYMTSNTIKVLSVLEAKDLNMSYRDGSKFEAKLLDGQGNAFVGQTITFNINGEFYDRITDDNGIARLNINLVAGEYIITSMYSNDATISNKITISSWD